MNEPEKIRAALRSIRVPELGGDLVGLEMIEQLEASPDHVALTVVLPAPGWPERKGLEAQVRAALSSSIGERPLRLSFKSDVRRAVGSASAMIPGVKHVVLCASGKGGVGKSTVASNLAAALHQAGGTVGLLDADIYGPSMPVMFKIDERPHSTDKKTIEPLSMRGMKLMSIGYLIEPHQALVWRGPMIANALVQLFRDVNWGELDYLVVDLPPGTGDVQLTISQQLKVSGAVVVSTPQDVALADVYRAKQMFDQVRIDVLGVVENMSYFVCDGCNKRHEIFASGGAKRAAKAAKELGLDLLADVPIDPRCREDGDLGTPVVWAHPDTPSALAFDRLATEVQRRLALKSHQNRKKGEVLLPIVSVDM
jgi:ATP-binding protein involved in chromosome partitioning